MSSKATELFKSLLEDPSRLLDTIGKAAQAARTLREFRARIAKAALSGDLDDAYSVVKNASAAAKVYIEEGISPALRATPED